MAKPTSTVISVNNKALGATVTSVPQSLVATVTNATGDQNPEVVRYPSANIAKADRGARARVVWNTLTTASGVKSNAFRFVIDCGEPVAADAIGLIDCNAQGGTARFYGSDVKEQFTPYWSTYSPTEVTSATPDVIYADVPLGGASRSGVNLAYPDATDWNMASRAMLNYFSSISTSNYSLPDGTTYVLPAGLNGNDLRNEEGRAYGSSYFHGSSALRPHMFQRPERYTFYSGTNYGDFEPAGGSTIPPILCGSENIVGDEEQNQYNVLRGRVPSDRTDKVRGRGGVDPIYWHSTDYRTDSDGANGRWQVNGSTKPVGFKMTPENPALNTVCLRRDSGNAVGSATFMATVGAKLETTGTGTWWNLIARGGSTSNYEGVWVAKGLGAAGTIRVMHWQPQSHPGDVFYWDVPDTFLGDWHVWQVLRTQAGTGVSAKLALYIDGAQQGSDIDVTTWTGGSTATFNSINCYRLCHNFINDQITALDASAVFGKTSLAYFSLMDWGYALQWTDLDSLKMDAAAEYQQASYDLGIREDDLKRRYWCVEFDELRGDMKIPGDYLELGGVWIGDRINVEASGEVRMSQERVGASSVGSYSGAVQYDAGASVRSFSLDLSGSGMSDSSSVVDKIGAATQGRAIVDLSPNSTTDRESGLALGVASSKIRLGSLQSSKSIIEIREDLPQVDYGSLPYAEQSLWSTIYGGVLSGGVADGSLFIHSELIQPGKRIHFQVSKSSDATAQVVGPAGGSTLVAGLLRPTYDASAGLPTAADWDISVRVNCMEDNNGLTGWSSTRGPTNLYQQPWFIDGVEHAVEGLENGSMFSFDRVLRIDFLASDNTTEAKYGSAVDPTDPDATITGISNTGSAIYGGRRLALYWFSDTRLVPGVNHSMGKFPTVGISDIP